MSGGSSMQTRGRGRGTGVGRRPLGGCVGLPGERQGGWDEGELEAPRPVGFWTGVVSVSSKGALLGRSSKGPDLAGRWGAELLEGGALCGKVFQGVFLSCNLVQLCFRETDV